MTRQLLFIFFALTLFSCHSTRVENYYLPLGFEGNVAIIYNSNGSKISDLNNRHIPTDGILKTEGKFVSGSVVSNYYQRNAFNSYDTLTLDLFNKDTAKNQIVFPRILTVTRYNSKEVFTVKTFYVGKKRVEDLAKERISFERKLEEMLFGR